MRYWRKAFLLVVLVGLLAWLGYGQLVNYKLNKCLHLSDQALAHLDFDKAQTEIEAALQIRPNDPHLHLRLAQVARRSNKLDLAEEHFQRFQQLAGESQESLLEYAMLRAQQGDLAHSQDFLLSALKRESADSCLILEALARGAMQVRHLGSAMNYLNQLIEKQPDHSLAFFWRGQLWEQSIRLDEALADYQHAIEIKPDLFPARLQLAIMLLTLKHGDEAMEQLQVLHQNEPANAQVLLFLTKGFLIQGETEKAKDTLETLLGLFPNHREGLVLSATLMVDAGNAREAEKRLRQICSHNPNDKEAHFQLARSLEMLGKQEDANRIRDRIKVIEKNAKERQQAIDKVQKAPNDPELRRQTALLCLRDDRNAEALSWLQGALQINPNHKPTHATLADFYDKIGREDLAAPHQRAAQGP